MLAETTVEVDVARGHPVTAHVCRPKDTRGIVAIAGEYDALAGACNNCGLATVVVDVAGEAEDVDRVAALFATSVTAITDGPTLRDHPVGYFGQGITGAAALAAAASHSRDVAAVVALNAPLELVGAHLSGVLAPTLLQVDPDNEILVERTKAALPPLLNTSTKLAFASDPGIAAEWFDHYLRGLMRGARRELWRLA